MNTARIAGKSAARIAGVAALAVAAALGMSACSLVAPVATMIQYDPADGVGVDLGDVQVRDAQALMGESGAVNLYFYVVNSSAESVRLSVAAGEAGADGTETITIPAGGAAQIGGPDSPAEVIIDDPTDVRLGGLYPVYFQAGDAAGQQVLTPVLDATDRPFFEDYLPQ